VKSGGNGATELSAQKEYVPGKADYLDSGGITDDPEEVERLRKSAEQGNSLAQNNLGVMYAEGHGVGRNEAEAVKWFRKSAEQGNPEGEANLGNMYSWGRGVRRDFGEAMKWYRKSAEQGNADALANLGGMYLAGSGVKKDYTEALKLFRKSAEQGNPNGEFYLGVVYHYGVGVNDDFFEAQKWFWKAEEHGNKTFKKRIESLMQHAAPYADAGGLSVFGRQVYLFGDMEDCSWNWSDYRCLLRKVGDRVYMATAYMRAYLAPYKFRFCDADCTPGTSFGYAIESKPGVYDFDRGTPIRLNSNTRFSGENEVIKATPPHDGLYDFYLDVSGDIPVTYIREHR